MFGVFAWYQGYILYWNCQPFQIRHAWKNISTKTSRDDRIFGEINVPDKLHILQINDLTFFQFHSFILTYIRDIFQFYGKWDAWFYAILYFNTLYSWNYFLLIHLVIINFLYHSGGKCYNYYSHSRYPLNFVLEKFSGIEPEEILVQKQGR